MTEQEQRIAIAEACGWQRWDVCSPIDRKTPIILWQRGNLGAETRCELPDYLHDLDAMHEASQRLATEQRGDFCKHLTEITSRGTPFEWRGFAFANATAAQRAEAFLRTIGTWKE